MEDNMDQQKVPCLKLNFFSSKKQNKEESEETPPPSTRLILCQIYQNQ